jgi:hypothetical protein
MVGRDRPLQPVMVQTAGDAGTRRWGSKGGHRCGGLGGAG